MTTVTPSIDRRRPRLFCAFTIAVALLVGCGGGDSPTPGPEPVATTAAVDAANSGKTFLAVAGGAGEAVATASPTRCGSATTGSPSASSATPSFLAIVASAVLTGCGNPLPPRATITNAAASGAMYRKPLLVTVDGSHLDLGLTVTSPTCGNATLSTTAPYVSSATRAYFHCAVSAVGGGTLTFKRSSDSTVLGYLNFTVPLPQVTMVAGVGSVTGNLVITLDPGAAPVTVDNFLTYVDAKFYDNTVFHRLSPGFVLQGGGFASSPPITTSSSPTLKPTNPPIALEVGVGLSNVQWSIAMARTNLPNSATSQFFINLGNNSFLDTSGGGYAVFGGVTGGRDLVSAMTTAPCSYVPALVPPGDCTPIPNAIIFTARQTL